MKNKKNELPKIDKVVKQGLYAATWRLAARLLLERGFTRDDIAQGRVGLDDALTLNDDLDQLVHRWRCLQDQVLNEPRRPVRPYLSHPDDWD